MSCPICLPVRPISLLLSLLNTLGSPKCLRSMCDTLQHHHLLHVDELRNVPLFSYFLGEVSIESHMGNGRQKSFGLVAAVEERELFGPLTWMNCWSNVFAGNTWIVYINMINIALINQIRVIYCCFSHSAPTGKLWRISQYKVHFLF